MSEPKVERREMQREWQLTGVIGFALLALVVLAAALKILRPFLSALVVAAVLVVLTWPLYVRLRLRLRNRQALAASLMLLGIAVVIVLPAVLLCVLLVGQANAAIAALQDPETKQMLGRIDLTSSLAFLQRHIPGFDPQAFSPQRLVMPLLQQVSGWVAAHGAALVGSLAGVVINLFLVLLAAWYFYVEGEALLEELAQLSPLPRRYDRQFGSKLQSVIEATFRGQVLTALAQGLATMVGLLITGVPGAVLWGSVAAVMALIPVAGAAIVWVPSAIYLAIAASIGHRGWWAAIFLAAWGVLVVSTIDNVVRPWAMKGRAEMPAIPLLFAVLGGLQAFGFIGLVVGPLVFSLVKSVVDIYKESFQDAPAGDAGDITTENTDR